jgi:hypothetical protein
MLVASVLFLGVLTTPAAADVGRPDDLVARGADGRLWLFTSPYLSEDRRIVGSDWNPVDRMTSADVTLDGETDIVAREPGLQDGTLWIHVNDPKQPTSPWTTRIWGGFGWNIASAFAVGDVTGDDRPDVITREADGRMWLYPHNGATTSVPYTTRSVIGAGWQGISTLLLADVTQDGRLDVVARDADGFLWVYPPPAALRAWNFSARADGPYDAGGGWERYNPLVLADVNGDGRPDVVGRDSTGKLWFHLHNGAAAGTNPWPTRVSAGDWWGGYTALLGV